MIGTIKLYACLLALVSLVKYIDGSCLKYGHSCWGAHGKRANLPPKENREIDRWEMFKISEGKSPYPYKKLIKENSLPQRFRYPDNERFNTLQKYPYDDDTTLDKIMQNSADEIIDDSDEFQRIFPQMNKEHSRYE